MASIESKTGTAINRTVTVSSKLFSFSSVRVVAVIRELKQERF